MEEKPKPAAKAKPAEAKPAKKEEKPKAAAKPVKKEAKKEEKKEEPKAVEEVKVDTTPVELPVPMAKQYEERNMKNAAKGADDAFAHIPQFDVASGSAVSMSMPYEELCAMSQLPEDPVENSMGPFKDLKLKELKAKLTELSLPTKGMRAELVARLEEAMRLERSKFMAWDSGTASWVPIAEGFDPVRNFGAGAA